MSATPIEAMLDAVEWIPTVSTVNCDEDIPVVTHSGVLEIAGHKLRCHRLSNDMTVFDADDFEVFFSELAE